MCERASSPRGVCVLLPGWKKMGGSEGGNAPPPRTNRRLRLGETRNNRVRIRHPIPSSPLLHPPRAPGSVTQQLFLLRGVTITFVQSATLQTQPPNTPTLTTNSNQRPTRTNQGSPRRPWLWPRPEALAFRLVRCDLFSDADARGGPRNRRLLGQ